MAETITFRGWERPAVGGLVTGVQQGRARAAVQVTLTATDAHGATTGTDSAGLTFLLAGPPDVLGLAPGAVARRYPAPNAVGAETTKCPYVELVDPGLPWRYTPAPNPAPTTRKLRPWMVLLVGTEDELPISGGKVTVAAPVQNDLKLVDSHRWAHVQETSSGRRIARLLSPRELRANRTYVAVLVPAYTPETKGAPVDAWGGTDSPTVPVLPVYDSWRFRTGPGGDFPALARRLKPGQADPATGSAPVIYPRVPSAGNLVARGALAPVGSTDAPLPAAVASDMAALASPPPDPRGRTVLGLPRYGAAWHDNPQATTWGATLNGDPRNRGAAGLGLRVGIQQQDALVNEATRRAGALGEAAQRIRHLSLGLAAGSALWRRRLPADPMRRLWVLAPTLRRTVSSSGVVADLATADGRALPRGIFSSAVRRILRPGPARTARAAPGAADPAAVLGAANRCPPPDAPVEAGVPLDDLGAGDFDQRLASLPPGGDAGRLIGELQAVQKTDPDHAAQIGQVIDDVNTRVANGEPLPWSVLASVLAALQTQPPRRDEDEIQRLFRLLLAGGQPADDPADLATLAGETVQPPGPPAPCREVQLGVLLELAFRASPDFPDGPARRRVLDQIEGLDPPTTVPPESCPGMDLPAWRLLNRLAPAWLLPGVGTLADDTAIALQTNPQFIDAFMVGLNTQLLAELRWRNIPVATGCTPMRTFWDRVDTASGERLDDLRGMASWLDGSALGDPQHQPDEVGGTDLVLVIRGQLFLRYPHTALSLVSAVHATTPDFGRDPEATAARIHPTFQTRIGRDVSLFGFQNFPATEISRYWVSLEEPPHGYQFFNNNAAANSSATDGADFANKTFADPVRVLVRGDSLAPGGVQ
jgi:hypothetical protein